MNQVKDSARSSHTQKRRKAKILITDSCLDDLKKHDKHQAKYDQLIQRLQAGDLTCARHAVRGSQCDRFKVFESTISKDLRLCWSYASHIGEQCVILWALDGHDHVFKRLKRLTGERFKEARFDELSPELESKSILVGDAEFEWRGPRPPTLLELNRDEVLGAWISDHLALSDEQALESTRDIDDGPVLLSGGGGSGKTTLLINLLLRQVEAGERPLLVTYHTKLAEYCKRLIGEHPLKDKAVACIKTMDELLREALTKLELSEHLEYVSQDEAKALFTRSLPEGLRDAAWAEFRGMWKGRMDVDFYTEQQRELRSLEEHEQGKLNLWLTAAGEYISLNDDELTPSRRKQIEQERYWLSKPRMKMPDLSREDAQRREALYEHHRLERVQRAQRQRELEERRQTLQEQKRRYKLSSHVYSRDVRFVEDSAIIEGAIEAYEAQLSQRGGDRLNACLEVLIRAHLVQSSYSSLLIDEVQDFTRLELQLLSLFVPNPKRWVVAGDENQIVNPSGFKWSRVKDVIWWSVQRLKALEGAYHELSYASQEELSAFTSMEPTHLTVNYRNPPPIQKLARHILKIKRHSAGWRSVARRAPHQSPHEELAQTRTLTPQGEGGWRAQAPKEEAALAEDPAEDLNVSAEESPWAWEPRSLEVSSERALYQHIVWLSKSVPSFCLIVFSRQEKERLLCSLKEELRRDPDALNIDFERVLTPLEVKGLEFDLVVALNPPLPTSKIEGIRDFEFNQLYVSATRSRVSLAYLWSSPEMKRLFRAPLNAPPPQEALPQEDQTHSIESSREGERPLITEDEWSGFVKLSSLHFAKDRSDWAKSAERYVLTDPKIASEQYRVGGFYRESAELLEQLGELQGAIRDYEAAEMPAERARCEAKLAEKNGRLGDAHKAWRMYAELSEDFEGYWRTLEGGMPTKGSVKSLAKLNARALSQGDLSLDLLGTQGELRRALSTLEEGSVEQQRLLRDHRDMVSLIKGVEGSALPQGEGSVEQRLIDLKQSPRAEQVRALSRDAQVYEKINPDPSLNAQQVRPLRAADLELLLGAVSYYENLNDQERGRAPLTLNLNAHPWSKLPRLSRDLFTHNDPKALPDSFRRFDSLKLANRVMWETEQRTQQSPGIYSARKVIRASLQAALYQWPKGVQFVHKLRDRGLLSPDRHVAPDGDVKPKRLSLKDWRTEAVIAYKSSGLGHLLSETVLELSGEVEVCSDWERLERRWREDLDHLIAIMAQLRLSHSPTRLYTAHRFAELWLSLMISVVGHWLHRPALESLTYLEDEAIERLSSTSMSDLKDLLSRWESSAWRALKEAPLSAPPSDQRGLAVEIQGRAIHHLMGLWSMGQALFLRGTWVGFVNEKLKRSENFMRSGYDHIRAANSHWLGLTFLPLHGLMSVLTKYEEHGLRKRERLILGDLPERQRSAKATLREQKARLKSIEGQRRDLRAELKRLTKSGADEVEQTERDREMVEAQLKSISEERELLLNAQTLKTSELEQLNAELEPLQHKITLEQARSERLKAQQEFFEWTLSQADSLSRRTRHLSDEAYEEVRAVWRLGREWSKLILDMGEPELLVFLPLLNRYRERNGLKALTKRELHFKDGRRRSSASRKGGQSAWLKVMSSLSNSSPLAQFRQESAEGELPSAGATLSFAVEQGYTPLALELLEDEHYINRAQEALSQLAAWNSSDLPRAAFKRELGVLCATPQRKRHPWLEPALELCHDRLRPLLSVSDQAWLEQTLRQMRREREQVPNVIARGVSELLSLWACLSPEEHANLRGPLFTIARLWEGSPLSHAIEGLLLGHLGLIERAAQEGELWVTLSPLCVEAYRSSTAPEGLLAASLKWLEGRVGSSYAQDERQDERQDEL